MKTVTPSYTTTGAMLYLYKNNKGKGFIRQETPLDGDKPFTGLSRGSVHFADMDNDGWLDIISSGYGPGEGISASIGTMATALSPKTGNTYTDHTIRLVSPAT